MNNEHDLTQGGVIKVLIRFALPFLFSRFMQALYGAVDLMVVGQFSGISAISAVNIGSQIMQILTCFIIGISMGVTVKLAHAVGCRDSFYYYFQSDCRYTPGTGRFQDTDVFCRYCLRCECCR